MGAADDSRSMRTEKEREREGEKEKGERKKMDFWLRGRQRCNFVAVGGSFNALANGAQRVYTTHEKRTKEHGSLICCMSAGSDAFIIRPPASKHTPVPSSSIQRRKTAASFTWSTLVVCVCVCLRTRNSPRGKHKSRLPRVDPRNGQWRPSRWNAREATVLRLLPRV